MPDHRDDPTAVTIFVSYAREDESLRRKLETYLIPLEREGIISLWHDQRIAAGSEWEGQISRGLETAGLILLLISPDFMASDYCNRVEIPRAMERHRSGEAIVIPILLRPTPDWENAPFRMLQSLPSHGRPVTKWKDRDDAFHSIASGIRKAVEGLARPAGAAPARRVSSGGEERGEADGPMAPAGASRVPLLKAASRGPVRPFVLGLAAGILVLLAHGSGWLERLEDMTLDARFRLAPASEEVSQVVIVELDQESKDRLSPRTPVSRGRHLGELINRLSDAGAATIGLDFLLSEESSPTEDGEMAVALRDTPAAVLAINLYVGPNPSGFAPQPWQAPLSWALPVRSEEVVTASRIELPAESLAKQAHRVGHVTLWADQDGVVRRLPLLLGHEGRIYPSLSLALAMQARGVGPEGVRLRDDETLEIFAGGGPALRLPLEPGCSMSINYRRGTAEPRRIPLWHVLEQLDAGELRTLVEGKVVLIGSSLDGETDLGPTPLRPSVALVEAHAHAVETILRQAFVLPTGPTATAAIVLGMAVLAAAAAWRLGPLLGLAGTAAAIIGYAGLAFWMFLGPTRRVDPMVAPLLGAIVAYMLEIIVHSHYNRIVARDKKPCLRSKKREPADLTTPGGAAP
jgi:CHASE2 domain-containing sensor protein